MNQTVNVPINPVADAQAALVQKKRVLTAQKMNGLNWFYWIAGLSLVNTVIYLTGGTINFILGLAVTQVVDVFAAALAQRAGANLSGVIPVIGLVLNVAIASVFMLYGLLGRRQVRWVIIAGMVLYALDGLLWLGLEEYLGAAFHLFVLWSLLRGLLAVNQLQTLEKPVVTSGGIAYPQVSAIGMVDERSQDIGSLILNVLAGLGTAFLVLLALGTVYLIVVGL